MHDAVAHKLRVFERRDHGKHALLLAPFEVGLAADQIIQRALRVVAPQLEHCIGVPAGLGVGQADGLEDAKAHGVVPAAGVDLDGHAALEHQLVLKPVYGCFLGRGQRVPERVVLLLRKRAVDVVRRAFAVARGDIGGTHVNALRGHDGRGRVKKVQELPAHLAVDRVEQRVRGQRAGRDHNAPRRDFGHLAVNHLDFRVGFDFFGYRARERLAVDRERAARLDAVFVRTGEDQAVQPPQFLFEQARGVGQLVRAQRVRAHQLGKVVRMVRRAVLRGFHLVQAHRDAALRELPGGLAPRKTRADNGYDLVIHPQPPLPPWQRPFSVPFPRPFRPRAWQAPWHTAPAGFWSAPAHPLPSAF